MAAQKAQLKDPTTGAKIYPVTSSACVGMSDGSGNLDNKLTELEGEIYNNFPISKKYYDPVNGAERVASSRNYVITGKVYIKGSEKIVIRNAVSNMYVSSVVFFDKGGEYISSTVGDTAASNNYSVTIDSADYPENAEYVGATSDDSIKDKVLKVIYPPLNGRQKKIDDNTESIENLIVEVSDNKENLQYIADLRKSENKGTDFPNVGFISSNGSTSDNEAFVYTDYIDISPIEHLYELSCNAVFGNEYGGGIAFYNEEKTYISSIYRVAQSSIGNVTNYVVPLKDIPSNAAFIRVVGSNGKENNSYKIVHIEQLSGKLPELEEEITALKSKTSSNEEEITALKSKTSSNEEEITALKSKTSSNEEEIAKLKTSIPQKTSFMNVVNEEITDGKKVELEYNNIRKNYSICGYINLTSFNKVRFGKDTSEQGYIVEVDSTNVKLERSRNGNDETPYPHGLTIETFLGFELRNVGGYSQLFIYSDSGVFKLGKGIINPGYDSAFFESVGTTGTLVSLSQVNVDYGKDIWLIQDSYGAWANWGWAYNIYKIGFDTFLIDSHGGAGSISQLNVLKTHLKYATPKYLVWAMGMNDRDTGESYNANWKTALDEVIGICSQKGIELVLCTIPNAVKEGYVNTYKNRYIRSLAKDSGYTLIDFADAVQLSFEGSQWKDGLLSDDDLHPNEKGGQVLSIRAITDFPQLLNGKTISDVPEFVE